MQHLRLKKYTSGDPLPSEVSFSWKKKDVNKSGWVGDVICVNRCVGLNFTVRLSCTHRPESVTDMK